MVTTLSGCSTLNTTFNPSQVPKDQLAKIELHRVTEAEINSGSLETQMLTISNMKKEVLVGDEQLTGGYKPITQDLYLEPGNYIAVYRCKSGAERALIEAKLVAKAGKVYKVECHVSEKKTISFFGLLPSEKVSKANVTVTEI